MRRNLIFQRTLAVFIFIYLVSFVLVIGTAVFSYSGLVSSSQAVDAKWAKLMEACKARADAGSELAALVQGTAGFDNSTATAFTDARKAVDALKVDPNQAATDDDEIVQWRAVQAKLSTALARLGDAVSKNPGLADGMNVKLDLVLLGNSEKQIENARLDYNASAQVFNEGIQRFPVKLIVRTMGFFPKSIYPADSAPVPAK